MHELGAFKWRGAIPPLASFPGSPTSGQRTDRLPRYLNYNFEN